VRTIGKTVPLAKRIPIRERKLRAWYCLRRNSNLYDIFLFRKAHCIQSYKATPSDLIDIMTPLCSNTVFLSNFKLVRTCTPKSDQKLDCTSVTSAISCQLPTNPLTKYLPKHVRKGSTRGQAHGVHRRTFIAVPSVESDGGDARRRGDNHPPSLRLSFVRTRRFAGGGIAEHGDLLLSHR
jgi:hypothetical protein